MNTPCYFYGETRPLWQDDEFLGVVAYTHEVDAGVEAGNIDVLCCGIGCVAEYLGTIHVVNHDCAVGQIGVYTGWVNDVAEGTKTAITAFDWIGLLLICFILPAVLTYAFGQILRKIGWIKEGDLKLDL